MVKYQWFWKENNGEFIPYDTHQNIQIDLAYQSGQYKVRVAGDLSGRKNNFEYDVWFGVDDNMSQDKQRTSSKQWINTKEVFGGWINIENGYTDIDTLQPNIIQQNTKTGKLRQIGTRELGDWICTGNEYIHLETLEKTSTRPINYVDVVYNWSRKSQGAVQTIAGTQLYIDNGGRAYYSRPQQELFFKADFQVLDASKVRMWPVKVVLWDRSINVQSVLDKLHDEYVERKKLKVPSSVLEDPILLEGLYWEYKDFTLTLEGSYDSITKAERYIKLFLKDKVQIPSHWEGNDRLVDLKPGSEEWNKVETLFKASCSDKWIVNIQRVQNVPLWEWFWNSKKRIEKKNGKEPKCLHQIGRAHV